MTPLYTNGYAVIVGVGADLPITIKDATAIANHLKDTSRCAYPKDQVHLLTGNNARRENILSELEWLARNTSQDDTAIVYFSGHGIENPDFHLVPFGFESNNLAETAITGQEFSEMLRSIEVKKLLVVLDCCHAGGQAEAKGYQKSPMPSEALAELGVGGGRVIVASSRKDEVSWTGEPYSVFTMAVLEALSGYGAFERDGFARVLDLILWAGRVVPERTNDKQHPIIKVSDLKDNFAIAWYAGGENTPKSLSWIETISTASTNIDTAQIASWRRRLERYRNSLLLVEDRMSQFVLSTDIPLQYVNEKQILEENIAELESKLFDE